MTLDYNTIRYVEPVGDMVRLHYTDGKKVLFLPTPTGRWIKKGSVSEGDLPDTYEPWTPPPPPTEPPADGSWVIPLEGATLTSGFGMRAGGMHYGIDLSTTTAPSGGPVRSVTDMVITRAFDAYEGGNSTAGTYVKGHSLDGAWTFTYNHGADGSLLVAAGQTVTTGTQLFTEGATGNVTGTHLHFETIEGNWPDPWAPPYNYGANFVDPLPVLRAHGVNI